MQILHVWQFRLTREGRLPALGGPQAQPRPGAGGSPSGRFRRSRRSHALAPGAGRPQAGRAPTPTPHADPASPTTCARTSCCSATPTPSVPRTVAALRRAMPSRCGSCNGTSTRCSNPTIIARLRGKLRCGRRHPGLHRRRGPDTPSAGLACGWASCPTPSISQRRIRAEPHLRPHPAACDLVLRLRPSDPAAPRLLFGRDCGTWTRFFAELRRAEAPGLRHQTGRHRRTRPTPGRRTPTRRRFGGALRPASTSASRQDCAAVQQRTGWPTWQATAWPS